MSTSPISEPPPAKAPAEASGATPPAILTEGASAGPIELGPADSMISQYLEASLAEEAIERRRLLRVGALAVVLHLVFFLITFPSWGPRQPEYVRQPGKIYVVQAVRFQKPAAPPPAGAATPSKKLAKKIPIPDPTPDEPEPIVTDDEIEVPETSLTKLNEVFFGIPGDNAGGPGNGSSRGQGGKDYSGDAFQLGSGSGITPPVAISKPEPRYTEEARRARVQGVVILSCVIDEQGTPRNLEVVKGLSLGLTESALETARTGWRFKPALKEGKPVPVYFLITINFSLQ